MKKGYEEMYWKVFHWNGPRWKEYGQYATRKEAYKVVAFLKNSRGIEAMVAGPYHGHLAAK
jgi:hypothetical protein